MHLTYTRIVLSTLLVVLVVAVSGVGGVQPDSTPADDPSEDEDDEGDVVIDLSGVEEAIEKLAEELRDFTGTWDTTLKELLIAVLFQLFRLLLQQLVRQVVLVLTNTPTIHPNPAVEEVHREVLLVSFILSGTAFSLTGILYMTGPLFGVSFQQVRMVIPRIIAALAFGSVSLPLLQYSVELADALVFAFAPSGLTMSFSQLAGLSVTLVLVWVINALLLLVVVIMFIIRNVYLLFTAAISPLLALAWAVPKTKRYADSFIAGYWTAWAMAPLDALVLKFVFALLDGGGSSAIQSLSNWVLGTAGFVLLIWIPFQLYGASQAAVGQAYVVARSVKNRVREHRLEQAREEFRENTLEQRSDRFDDGENKFDYGWGDDD